MKTETAVILLIAATFLGGIVVGAVGYQTLTEKPAMARATIPAGLSAHAAASMTAIPVPVVTAVAFNAYVAKVCPTSGIPKKADGEIVTTTEMLKCLVVAATNTRDAQKDPVTPRPPSTLDPNKAAR